MERPLSTGQGTATKRERQRKQSSGSAEFAATNIASDGEHYPTDSAGRAISGPFAGGVSSPHTR